jgi:nucleoid DNA-binding protein
VGQIKPPKWAKPSCQKQARAVIAAVFDSIKDALGRHERVELPIGTFTVLQNPDERRSWRFRKVTVLYAHRYKVEFLPSAKLNLAADHWLKTYARA